MNQPFTPGQYVKVRATEHSPWEARIFHSWNEPRLGNPHGPYARVTTAGVFQFDTNAPTESFLLVEAWRPEPGQWAWFYFGEIHEENEWGVIKIADWFSIPDVHPYIYGGAFAPFTLPPFVAPGDKY